MKRLLLFLFTLLTGYQASAQLSPLAIGDMAPGKSVVVIYDVTVNNPTSASVITNRGVISGTNFATVSTNITNTPIVSSNANLSALALSPGTLSPPFASSITAYTASVPNSASSVAVTPTVEQANATVSVNGSAVASGSPINVPLAVCANIISVSVTAQDGTTTKIYSLTVNRDAPPVILTASSPISCTAPVVTLTATSGFASYVFGGGASQVGGASSNTATVATAGTYSVTATAAGGCSSTATLSVTGSTTATPVNLTLSGAITCANPTVTLTATSGLLSYTFSDGATQSSPANTATVSTSGVYSVSATNASYCVSTTNVTVTGSSAGSPVSLTVSGAISCSSTSVTLTASSGFTTYVFDGGASQQGGSGGNTAVVSTSGVYSVTATDANACSSTANVSVSGNTTPTPVTLTASGTLSCTNTAVTITATPGFDSYIFSTGAAQQGGSGGNTAIVSTTGVYSVTATNAAACSSTTNVTVNGDGPSPINLTASSPISCTATSVTLTATSGFVSYTFNNGAIQGSPDNTATVSTSGVYSVSATNGLGCVSSTSITVTGSSTPTPVSLTAGGTLSCPTPIVTLTATSGFVSYVFSASASQQGGPAGNTATVNTAGVYSVTATNANACSSTAIVTVTGSTTSTPVSLTTSGTLSCTTPTVTLTATAGFVSYVFSASASQQGGPAGNTATVNTSGIYSVTATNANGCSTTATVTVTGSSTPIPVNLIASGTLSCTLPTVTLTATSGFVSYVFSASASQQGGPAGNTATVNTAGVYSVTATNANACSSTAIVTVTGSSTPTPVNLTSNSPISCITPTVTLTATSGFVSYVFSASASQQGGPAGNTATVNTAGVYSVTATNANACSSTAIVTVTGSSVPTPVSLTAGGTLSCPTPIVTLTATAGFASYVFSSGASQQGGPAGNTATVNTSGIYSVTATNANACSSTAIVTVTGSTTATPVNLTASGPISCSAPTVTLTATAGLVSYTFSTGASQQGGPAGNTATVITSGSYSVSATNASGCVSTTSIAVTGSSTGAPVSLTSNGPISCPTPTVTLTATSGFVSYVFSTSATQQGGSGGNTTTVSTSGVYSVTAIDANACSSTAIVTVTGGSTPTPVSLTTSGTLSCTTPTVTLTATAGFVSYVFGGGATQQGGSGGHTATVNATGIYSVTATNANACSSTAVVTVTGSSTATPVSLSVSGTLSCSVTSVTLTASPGFTGYVFSPGTTQLGGSGGNTAVVSTSGVYSVSATNASGCQSATSITVGYQNCPPTVANAIPPQSASVGAAFSYTIPANTFTDPETPNNLVLTVSGLPAGLSFVAPSTITGSPSTSVGSPFTVTVVATDPQGLSVSTTFSLSVAPTSFAITSVSMLDCNHISYYARRINFMVSYSGTNGQPISLSVVNELTATTASGPYSLTVFTDNPVITITARQQGTPGMASFNYNWLANCANGSPIVLNPIPPQSATLGQSFNYAIPANTFTDAETPNSLVLSVTGLPPGLTFGPPSTLTGTPSTTLGSPYNVTVVATDPGGATVVTTFQIDVSPSAVVCPSMVTVKAGPWNDPTTWSCGRVPTQTDIVTLNHLVNLPDGYVGKAFRVIYTAGGRLSLGSLSRLQLFGQ
ncbi:cadherin-like beta sandwich domain-containing protein [Spirosoma sp. BT702]|uniref:Cadherin-like beta sandwich domain-containing protein n=1 Tax=Spirosoma profusum TaxID=2771354 RepID=A0A927APH2_9BACT|nr:putative Ig domain-containing protein [Spirosoma profusum]MBD2704519.1 cadherin-like beta sandwich domain-containing protein [Spirosoma profusum]